MDNWAMALVLIMVTLWFWGSGLFLFWMWNGLFNYPDSQWQREDGGSWVLYVCSCIAVSGIPITCYCILLWRDWGW
jgi:hypothetical protein